MIEQLRRAVEAKPALEPFASGRRTIDASGTANVASSSYAANNIRAWLSGDASTPSTTSANATKDDDDAFDAVAYAREAFSRSRRGGAGSGGDALDDVALLADGARTMEALIRDEVIGKRETLEEALRGVEEAEATMKTIREGANEIADAMRRVAREIGEPHESVEASTRTLERVMATGETLRGVVKVLKLTSKLRECYGGGDDETRSRDASELSKAAKLLGEVKLTLKSAGRDFDGVDVVDEQMVFIQDCSVAVSREANEALDRGMETASQADVGAALQVHYNLNELSAVVDARVASYTNAAVDAVKDAVDAESVGKTATGASGDGARRGSRGLVAPPSGAEHAWEDALWRRVDVAMETVQENDMAVWHLQRVLAKKRDPLTQTLFLDEVVGKTASTQALCDRFWAVFAKGVSEHLSRTHAAGGFVSRALQKGFPSLIGALEDAVAKCARDADAAKGAPGCTRKDGTTRALVLRACEPIAAAFFAHSSSRLSDAANYCFADGRVIDEASADRFLSRIRAEIDVVAEYDNLLNNACGNASSALKTLADRAKRSIGRSIEASSLTEEATPTQRANAQIAEQLARAHGLMSKVLPSFAPTPKRALEVGLEHIESAVREATRPLFDAVGDWCDARFTQMHNTDYSSTASDGSAKHIIAVTSTLGHVADSHPGLFTAARGPLFAARVALGDRILHSFVVHASLIRDFDQGGKMRLVKECGEIELAVVKTLRLAGAETESMEFKSIKAFKSLVLLPTENIEASPLVRDVSRRALLHHLYSRAPADLTTPANRASLSQTQYASWLLKKASDAEVWRGVKGTLDVFTDVNSANASHVAVALMRKIGESFGK